MLMMQLKRMGLDSKRFASFSLIRDLIDENPFINQRSP